MHAPSALCSIALLALALGPAAPSAARAAEFSADMLVTQAGGTVTGRIHARGKLLRLEQGSGARRAIVITRPDKGVIWLVNPDAKAYLEMPDQGRQDLTSTQMRQLLERSARREDLAEETVEGFACTRTRYVYNDTAMGVLTVWVAKKLGHAIRSEVRIKDKTMVTELKKIELAPQPEELFTVPEGYQRRVLKKQ